MTTSSTPSSPAVGGPASRLMVKPHFSRTRSDSPTRMKQCYPAIVTLYLDMCAIKRAYDTQVAERVRLETLAVANLLDAHADGRVEIVASAILAVENEKNPDPARRRSVAELLARLPMTIDLTDDVVARAREIEGWGLRPLDALHAASAEAGRCDYLVTTDDRMAKRLRTNATRLRVRVTDPLNMAHVVEEMELP